MDLRTGTFFQILLMIWWELLQEPKSTTSSPLLPESAGYVKDGNATYFNTSQFCQATPSYGCCVAESEAEWRDLLLEPFDVA